MRLSPALLISGCLLFSGCGGGDDAEPAAKGTPDPAEEKAWAGKVTGVCRDAESAAKKTAADAQEQGLQGRELVAEVLEKSIPVQRGLIDDLDAIDAPEQIQGDYDQFVSTLRDGLPLYEKLAKAVRENDQDPQLEKDLKQLGEKTRPFAVEHGLDECLPDQS